MMGYAGFNYIWREILWTKEAKLVSYLDGLLVEVGEENSPMAKFYGNKTVPRWYWKM